MDARIQRITESTHCQIRSKCVDWLIPSLYTLSHVTPVLLRRQPRTRAIRDLQSLIKILVLTLPPVLSFILFFYSQFPSLHHSLRIPFLVFHARSRRNRVYVEVILSQNPTLVLCRKQIQTLRPVSDANVSTSSPTATFLRTLMAILNTQPVINPYSRDKTSHRIPFSPQTRIIPYKKG